MCTLEKRANVFILTLTGSDEHRIDPTLIDSIKSALDRVRTDSSPPSALITTGTGKFFSNGLDLSWAKAGGSQTEVTDRVRIMTLKLRSLVTEFMSLPMPTIAAVNGHASGGGLVLVLCHDYVYMRKDRGFLYANELDLNLSFPAWFINLLWCKVGSPPARRDMVLAAKKLTAHAAMGMGIVDASFDSAELTIEAAAMLGEQLVKRNWDGHVYAQIRKTLYAEMLNLVQSDESLTDRIWLTNFVSRI